MNQFQTKQEELDYEALIQTAGKAGTGVPEHDCHAGPEDGCQTCEDYQESRTWWLKEQEQQAENNNQKLL